MIRTFVCIICGYKLIKEELGPPPVMCLVGEETHTMELEEVDALP